MQQHITARRVTSSSDWGLSSFSSVSPVECWINSLKLNEKSMNQRHKARYIYSVPCNKPYKCLSVLQTLPASLSRRGSKVTVWSNLLSAPWQQILQNLTMADSLQGSYFAWAIFNTQDVSAAGSTSVFRWRLLQYRQII